MGSSMKTISYRYDANRNRTLMIDPDGGRTTYAYDALNRITSLINPQGERTTYAYDAKGRRTVKKLANGTRASFTYDAANRITTLSNLKSDNSVISKFDYKYDKVGNRTEVDEADGSRVTWSYDATYQLTAEHRTGTVPYRNTFTYDSVGNRLLKNESGARTTYSYDASNQLSTSIDSSGTTTYTFDADGNQQLVQAPNNDRTTTVWDYENKTTSVQLPSGIRNTMAYEPDGLRVKLEESTGTKKFIWDDQNYLAESDESNDINVVYTNEPNYYGNLVSRYRKTGAVLAPSYYHYEALGSTRQLTDNSESITDTYLYDAWGNVINSSGTTENPFQFTGNVGYYFDVDTENQYIRARIYSPRIGRWLSVDPLGFVEGLNLLTAYFAPNLVDPSGMFPSPWDQSGPFGGQFDPNGPVLGPHKRSPIPIFEDWFNHYWNGNGDPFVITNVGYNENGNLISEFVAALDLKNKIEPTFIGLNCDNPEAYCLINTQLHYNFVTRPTSWLFVLGNTYPRISGMCFASLTCIECPDGSVRLEKIETRCRLGITLIDHFADPWDTFNILKQDIETGIPYPILIRTNIEFTISESFDDPCPSSGDCH